MKTTAKKGVGAIVGAWLMVKAQEFIAYTDTVDTIDWSAVGSTAISELMTGAVALIALFTQLETPNKPVVRKRLDVDPDFDSFDVPARPSVAPVSKQEPLNMSALRAELKVDEGVMYETYHDSEGFRTAGIGHKLLETDPEYSMPIGTEVSAERVQQWFNSDVSTALSDARAVVTDFDSHPEMVRRNLVNMAFNLGREGLSKFKKTLALINQRRYSEAAEESLNSLWADQVGKRATRLASRLRMVDSDIRLA